MGSFFGDDEQTSTSSSTTSADPVYTEAYEDVQNRANTLSQRAYDPNADRQVAGLNSTQNQAFSQVQNNQGNWQPDMGQARNMTAQGGSAISGADVQGYMSPYQQNVIDTTQQQFNTQNARQDQELNSQLARRKALYGSGRDVAAALQREAQQNAQNPVIAQLYERGYTNAQGAAQTDRSRALQAGSQYGTLAGQQQQYALNDANALLAVGNQQQQQVQNENDAATANAQARNQYDYDQVSYLAGITQGGTNMSSTVEQDQTQDTGGSTAGQIAGLAATVLGAFAQGGSVYATPSYVPQSTVQSRGLRGAQAANFGQSSNNTDSFGSILDNYRRGREMGQGFDNLTNRATATTDSNGWTTSVDPDGASGWGNYLSNSFGFNRGGQVRGYYDGGKVVPGIQDVFSNIAMLEPGSVNDVRPIVEPNGLGGMTATDQPPPPPPPPSAPAEAEKRSGLFGLFSDPVRRALVTGGLAAMGSRSGVPAMALGQGGVQGMQAYHEAKQEEANEAHRKQQIAQQAGELRQRQLEAQQRYTQSADSHAMEREKHAWNKQYQQAQMDRMKNPTRGTTPQSMTPEQRAAYAAQYGLKEGTPEYQTFVLGGRMSNPPRQMPSILDRETVKADVGQVKEMKEAAAGSAQMLTSLDQLEAARGATKSEGPWQGWAATKLGTEEAQRINSVAEDVRLAFIGKTKGAISEGEMRIFGQATPGMMMGDEAAAPVIQGMRLAAQRSQEQAKFFDQWMRANGSLAGAPEAWSKFITEKPVIIRKKDGTYKFEPANVASWRPYMQQAKEPGAGLLPDAPEADGGQSQYTEGQVLENAAGEKVMLQDNQWVPVQ